MDKILQSPDGDVTISCVFALAAGPSTPRGASAPLPPAR